MHTATVHQKAMHRSLYIAEIRLLIVSELDPVQESNALAVLARTSTFFHHIALDALWREQGTIMNVLRCIPADVWPTNIWRNGETLRRLLTSVEWDTVFKYARRVRSVHWDGDRYNDAQVDRYTKLLGSSLSVPGRCLLPNLETLVWTRLPMPPCAIDLLLGPQVTEIGIRLSDYERRDVDIRPVLTAMEARRSGLVTLSIIGMGAYHSAHPELLNFLRGLTCLEHFRYLSIDWETLIHLGNLSSLKTIDTCLPLTGSVLHVGAAARSLFPALVRARLRGQLCPVLSVVQSWDNPPLRSIVIDLSVRMDVERLDELYQALADHVPQSALHNLEVTVWQTTPTFIHPGDIFRPICCFIHLRTVRIEAPAGYRLDDEAFFTMACAWPHIMELSLTSHQRYSPQCTLLSLYHLSQHCPKLTKLETCLDATHLPHLAAHAPRLRQEALVFLDVQSSPLSDPPSVAAFITLLFPNLGRVWSRSCRWREYGALWKEVHLLTYDSG
ncbi:hypothetical protein C8R47DRAFT_1084606 [Mycena vitilis]|nr:hypothetical protein C8R47DRAFT_1084606 [Mycena vitilis]